MRARIVGGALAWAVSLAPLVVVNLIAYLGVFTLDEAAVIGALALVAGVALGAATAGHVGGRAPDLSAEATEVAGRMARSTQRAAHGAAAPGAMLAPRLGARGALAAGGIAATLYALTMVGLILVAGSFNILPNIVTLHPIRITAAILCVAAVFLGLAMLVGWLAARGATVDDMEVASSVAAGGQMSALGATPGAPQGGRVMAAPALRAPVAATRPLGPSASVRGAAARATRPLSSTEYGGPQTNYGQGAYGQAGYADQGAHGASARPSPSPSRPGVQRDWQAPTPAPAGQPRDAYAQRDPYAQRDWREPNVAPDDFQRREGYAGDDEYHSRAANQRAGYDDEFADGHDNNMYSGEYDDYTSNQRPRHTRPARQAADRRSRQRSESANDADAYYDDEYDEYDDTDGWRDGDDRRRGSRAGARRPARGDDRYDRHDRHDR